jgi:hypothetical protein
MWMKSSRVVRASESQCRSRNCLGSIPASSDTEKSEGRQMKAVLNIVHKKILKNPYFKECKVRKIARHLRIVSTR